MVWGRGLRQGCLARLRGAQGPESGGLTSLAHGFGFYPVVCMEAQRSVSYKV